MKTLLSSLWAILFSSSVLAIPITRTIQPNSSFEHTLSFGACSTAKGKDYSASCNPALFNRKQKIGIKASINSVAEGKSVENGKTLVLDPISREFLQDLFEQKAYNSFTLDSAIDFKTPFFNLTYSPFYLIGDMYVFNPTFPEIALLLIRQKTLRISSGMPLPSKVTNGFGKLSVGGSFYYYERKEAKTTFGLVELVASSPRELIQFENTFGVAGDLGLNWQHKSLLIPDLSFQVKNIGSTYEVSEAKLVSERDLEPLLTFETYSLLGVGKEYSSKWGSFFTEFKFPLSENGDTFYIDYTTWAVLYTLNQFSAGFSLSKFHQTTGIKFSTDNTAIGLLFGSNRSTADFSGEGEQTAMLNLEVSI